MPFDINVDDTWDSKGYPVDGFIEWLKTAGDQQRILDEIIDYFENSGYGAVAHRGSLIGFCTRGWSGCEEVIDALVNTSFNLERFHSMERGGLWLFHISDLKR